MKKIVLVGGPSSGKSTLIGMLAERGYDVVREAAKDLILERGGVDAQDRDEYIRFQCDVFDEQVRREEKRNKEKGIGNKGGVCFCDRGVYDNIAYCEKDLGYVPEILGEKLKGHGGYDGVFVLDRLPFSKEGFRLEDSEEEAAELHERIVGAYEGLGYDVERIPVMGRVERLEFLLGRFFK